MKNKTKAAIAFQVAIASSLALKIITEWYFTLSVHPIIFCVVFTLWFFMLFIVLDS